MAKTLNRKRLRGPWPSLSAFFEQTGIKQHDIAADCGISDAHLSNIISGKRVPSLPLALELSRVTNVPVEAISRPAA